MDDTNVLSMFLKIVTEYEYLDFTEQELTEDFAEILQMAVAEVQLQGIIENNEFDVDFGFSESLTVKEAYILAYACALIWVTPKVNSSEMLAYALTSTDFTLFSPSNRLQSCIKLKTDAQTKLNNLIADYDSRDVFGSIRAKLEDGDK